MNANEPTPQSNNQISKSKQDHRHIMLINPQFQLRFIAYITSFTLIGLAVMYSSNYIFFVKLHSEGKAMGLPPDHMYFEFIQQKKWSLTFIFLISSVGLFVAIFIAGLYLSHKLAGPVYRIEKWVNEVVSGQTNEKLSFREHDFFPEMAENINKLKDYFESRR